MQYQKGAIAAVTAAVLAIAFVVAGCNQTPQPVVKSITSDQLFQMVEQSTGRPVVVNFWATWCPPCVEEMPVFTAFYREHPADQVVFFSVSVDHPDTIASRVRPYARDKQLPFPVYVLADSSAEAIGVTWKIDWHGEIPATVVFNADGTIAAHKFEQTDAAWLKTAVSQASS